MRRLLLMIVSFMLSAMAGAAGTVFSVDFSSTELSACLGRVPADLALARSRSGTACLATTEKTGSFDLKPIAVEPGRKYKLVIRAGKEGPDTIEHNERIHDIMLCTWGRRNCRCDIRFSDAAGKPVGRTSRKRIVVESVCVITETMHDYVHVFYTPPTASSLTLGVTPNKSRLRIESIRLETAGEEEGTINCNPDFRYGVLSYCGWKPARDGRLHRRPDGKVVLNSGYGGSSPVFPLQAGAAYRFSCRGSPASPKARASVYFYDKNDKQIGSSFLSHGEQIRKGIGKELVPPPAAQSGKVIFYSMIIEELKVTRRND